MPYQGMSHLNLLTQLKSKQISNTALTLILIVQPCN